MTIFTRKDLLNSYKTVKNYNIPIKLFVLENKGYLTMKLMQKKNFNFITGADPSTGVSFPSFKKIANTNSYNLQLSREHINFVCDCIDPPENKKNIWWWETFCCNYRV